MVPPAKQKRALLERSPRSCSVWMQEPAATAVEKSHNQHLDQKQKRGEMLTLDLTLTTKDAFCGRGEVLEVETP